MLTETERRRLQEQGVGGKYYRIDEAENKAIGRERRTEKEAGGGRMILAIDPGTEQSAFVIMDPETRVIALKGIFYNDDIMQSVIYYHLDKYDRAAIEMIASYGMPVGKEVFETCVWIGKFMQLLSSNNKPVNLVYRKDVKMHLCGSTRAKDANIRQALIDLLGKEKTKGVSKDMWAALGVAVTVAGIQ